MDSHSQIAVVGTGLAGLVAASALAQSGARVACLGPTRAMMGGRTDLRTTALLGTSVRLLDNLGLWADCAPHAAPLEAIRIIDDTGRLLRAPDVAFSAHEIGEEAFGYNVPNARLLEAAWRQAESLPGLTAIATQRVAAVTPDASGVAIHLSEDDDLRALLVVGADGRESLCREAAGIATSSWRYDQTAIAGNFCHTEPHHNTCTELHRPAGPFTVVPLPGQESSLVWVERPEEVERLRKLPEDAFGHAIEQRLQGLLGTVTSVGPRAAFPLSGLTAHSFARDRIALVGEAAHVIPPIGAQGLNLGLRDVATLADCVAEAIADDGDPGSDAVLEAYDRARRTDVLSRTAAVDVLNRSLLSGFVPMQAVRGAALHAINAIGPLRRFVMRQGVSPTGPVPSLMR